MHKLDRKAVSRRTLPKGGLSLVKPRLNPCPCAARVREAASEVFILESLWAGAASKQFQALPRPYAKEWAPFQLVASANDLAAANFYARARRSSN